MINDQIAELKQQLAAEALRCVEDHHWMLGAQLLRLDEARMCHLRKGRIERFSVERFIRMLASVNRRVDMTIVNVGPARLSVMQELYPHLARRPSRGPVEISASVRGGILAERSATARLPNLAERSASARDPKLAERSAAARGSLPADRIDKFVNTVL